MTFTNQIRNHSVVSWMTGLQDFWVKLGHARASFANRVRVVFTAAWPRAMHGVSSCFVERKHWTRLRSKFMQAMHLAHPGANARLQMMLGPVGLDPFLFAVLQTFRDYRDFGCTPIHVARLDAVTSGALSLPPSSVTEVLQSRLHAVGWQWQSNGLVRDGVSLFSLSSIGLRELRFRLMLAWPAVVASTIHHRLDFRGFERVDWLGAQRALSRYSPFHGCCHTPWLHDWCFVYESSCL